MTLTRTLAAYALAGTATAAALLLAGPAVVSPFVTPGVLAAHVLTALPLAAILAGFVPRTPTAVVAGIAVALLTAAFGDGVGPWLEESEVDFVGRALVRPAWCLVLAGPWFVAIGPVGRRPGRELALAAAVAILVPGSYVSRVIDSRTADLDDALRRGRADRAVVAADALLALGKSSPLNFGRAKAPFGRFADDRNRIRDEADALRRTADPSSPPVTDRARTARGVALGRLGRTEDATAVFRELADRDPEAELYLAVALQTNEQYDDSDVTFRRVIDRALPIAGPALATPGSPATPSLAAAADRLRRGYEGLAFNARMTKRFDDGAAWYEHAKRTFVGAEAYFEFQLGLHFASADRPGEAVRHFERAATLAPDEFGPAATKHLTLIRRDTPACFILR